MHIKILKIKKKSNTMLDSIAKTREMVSKLCAD